MSAFQDRRGFLRGLATLPLVGGSVALIGAPTAVAETTTPALLEVDAFHGLGRPDPSTRAALVLSAVDCDWRAA